MESMKRELEKIRKQNYRNKKPDVLHHQAKSLVAMLVFLGAPWQCIKTVLMAKICRWPVCNIKGDDITEEQIKKWATEAVKKEPGLCDMADDPQRPKTMRSKRWVLEWQTANWVNAQNMKGIPVPSSLLRDHYRSLWGMGPHAKSISDHLDQLDSKKLSCTNWLRGFRQRWGYVYKGMPTKAPMTKDEIMKKARADLSHVPSSKPLRAQFPGPARGAKKRYTTGFLVLGA